MFMPLLTSFFFFILVGNMFEVVPGFSFSANSRVAIPLVLALVSWFTYNIVGIRQARVLRLPAAHDASSRRLRRSSGTGC